MTAPHSPPAKRSTLTPYATTGVDLGDRTTGVHTSVCRSTIFSVRFHPAPISAPSGLTTIGAGDILRD